MSLAGLDVTRFIALSSGKGRDTPNEPHDLTGPRTRRVHRRARLDLGPLIAETIADDHSGDAFPLAERLNGLDVIRQIGSGAIGGGGKSECEPIGFDHLIVVPLRAASQAIRPNTRKEPQGRRLGDQPRRWQVQFRFEPVIPPPPQPRIDLECGAKRETAFHRGAVGADEEGKRTQEPWGDPRQRAPLADGLARAPEMSAAERSQPAVGGLLMIEGGAAAEIRRLHERHAKTAARRLVARRRARRCRRRSRARRRDCRRIASGLAVACVNTLEAGS